MDRLSHVLQPEYQRWSKQLIDYSPPSPHAISLHTVLRAHFLLCDYFLRAKEPIAAVGPRNADLLASAISRQSVGFGNVLKWKSPYEVTATLFYGLVKNHPFHDGNKRTALLIALHQLTASGRLPDTSHTNLEELVVRTAANELHLYRPFVSFRRAEANEVDAHILFLADYFRRNTRRSDKRFYAITFNELEVLLPRFGFRLANPSGNFIDVVRDEVESHGFFKLQKRTVTKKIAQIGYPGGTKEVGPGAIATIRKECGLTPEKGIDSKVFFKDADPLSTLIDRYHGVLQRLKDK